MSFTTLLFYLFSGILIASAVATVSARQPVHSALSLVLAFVTMAALWISLGAEFLGLALVLIYVGAVMVFFLFVIMMLDLRHLEKIKRFKPALLPLVLVGIVMFAEITLLLVEGTQQYQVAPLQAEQNTYALGALLFSGYLVPLIVIAVLLLAAMIAAIALTHRQGVLAKRQNPADQIAVTAADRLRMVKVASVPDEPETPPPHNSQWQ